MNDNAVSIVLLGFLVGVLITVSILGSHNSHKLSKCAEEHDVFKCEVVYQPVINE